MEDKMKEISSLKKELDAVTKDVFTLEEHFSKIEAEKKREKELDNLIANKKKEHDLEKKRRALAT